MTVAVKCTQEIERERERERVSSAENVHKQKCTPLSDLHSSTGTMEMVMTTNDNENIHSTFDRMKNTKVKNKCVAGYSPFQV